MQTIPQAKKILSVLLLSAVLNACGGSGSGGGPSGSSPLSAGSFTSTVETSGSFWAAPFNGAAVQYIRLMQLYRASDINGSGDIVAVRFQRENGNVSAVTCPNTSLRLAHTSLDALTGTFADNVEEGKGSAVTIIDNEALVIPAGVAGTYFDIPLGTPFHYNGVDNLVVELARSEICSSAVSLVTDANVGYFARVSSQVSDTALTGTVGTGLISTAFVFEGGDKHLDFTVGSPEENMIPFHSNLSTEGRKVQLLYEAADIDGAGPITGIGMPVGLPVPTEGQLYTVTIRMGHSTLSGFVNGPFADSYADAPVTVAENLGFRVPPGLSEGEVVWLPLTGVFNYNGVDNLVVEIESTDNSEASEHVRWAARVETGANHRLMGNLGSAEGFASERSYPARFRFHGSTIARVSVDGVGDPWIFPNVANGTSSQVLYLSSDLGTAGTITKLACRMNTGASTGMEYPNFRVRMSHTDETALVAEMEDNLPNPVEVFADDFVLPGGLLRGDWIEIPLTTGFDYNGTQNLVIETRSEAGTVSHACLAKEDATRYASQYGGGITHDSVAAGIMDFQRDLRLWISK